MFSLSVHFHLTEAAGVAGQRRQRINEDESARSERGAVQLEIQASEEQINLDFRHISLMLSV